MRFFKHLVEEHRSHEVPQDEQWLREDADYAESLASAEEELSNMEEEFRREDEALKARIIQFQPTPEQQSAN